MLDSATEEKAIAIAETKRQMHEELEGEEKKTGELREMVKDLTGERDELRGKMEEVEKSGEMIIYISMYNPLQLYLLFYISKS